jgi:hypothetical protein
MATDNYTTHCIYRIVCFQNAKIYVGQTRDFENRKQKHLRMLKRDNHHSPYLQQAYNKYGQDSIFFEIIEGNIPSDEINAREIHWINYFNSHKDGFNVTPGGQTGGSYVPCEWNGIHYGSITQAAKANGVSKTAMRVRVSKGYKCDADVPLNQPQKCIWNGIEYPSMTTASKAVGIGHGQFRNFVKKGYTCDADIQSSFIRPCEWNGIRYESVSQAARAIGISPEAMTYRIDSGYKTDGDLMFIRKRTR